MSVVEKKIPQFVQDILSKTSISGDDIQLKNIELNVLFGLSWIYNFSYLYF